MPYPQHKPERNATIIRRLTVDHEPADALAVEYGLSTDRIYGIARSEKKRVEKGAGELSEERLARLRTEIAREAFEEVFGWLCPERMVERAIEELSAVELLRLLAER